MTRILTKNQAFHANNPQSGNVFLIILVGVALFAALSYTVSQSMQGGADTISKERAKFAAQEMINYGQQLRDAVKMLMISNGCTDTQITFEGATYYTGIPYHNNYNNTSAPTSKKCHVFDIAGGGMRYVTPASDINKTGITIFDGAHCYEGHGTGITPCPDTAKELSMGVANIPLSVCLEVNKIAVIGIPGSTPPIDNYSVSVSGGLYNGVYSTNDSSNSMLVIGAPNKAFGCYQDSAGSFLNNYIFYYILLAR